MITVLDINGNRFQIPAKQVKTVEELRMQLLSLFQFTEDQFDIFFDKKQLNMKSLLPPNNTEHPFIIIFSKPDKFSMPKLSSQNVSKGRFNHLFLKNSIIPSENLYDYNSSPIINMNDSSSSSSDGDELAGNPYFYLDEENLFNNFDFFDLNAPLENYQNNFIFAPDSSNESNSDLSSTDENSYEEDGGDGDYDYGLFFN